MPRVLHDVQTPRPLQENRVVRNPGKTWKSITTRRPKRVQTATT